MTTVEEAKLAIDLVGLEYPADIKATYDDLPTTCNKLVILREHLYYLYTIGIETGNDDLADYAMFANLHVRYRILQFEDSLTPADAYFLRIYEQKLPLMKWHPVTIHHATVSTTHDEVVEKQEAPDVIEVSISPSYEPELHSLLTIEAPQIFVAEEVIIPDPLPITIQESVEQEEREAIETTSLTIRPITYGKVITLRTYYNGAMYSVYLDAPSKLTCFGLCDYGAWFYDTEALYARLFRGFTGRFAYYDDAAIFLSFTRKRKSICQSLMSLSLRRLSKTWFTSPPPPRLRFM